MSGTRPLFSIVVPSFNQGRYLRATLQSLIDQEIEGLEWIVVDGGSSDESPAIIREFAPHIAWWVSEPDRGQSHALNKGFAHASGEWLAWLNSDDLLLPGCLKRVARAIEESPDVRWWIGSGHFIREDGRLLYDYGSPPKITHPRDLADWRQNWFAQPSTFFRRDLWEEAGAQVREDLHYAMDLDLWLRFLALAAPGRIDAPLSCYRYHELGKTMTMAANGECEIVSVLASHLGIADALARVRLIATERDHFRAAAERYERVLKPALRVRQWWRRLRSMRSGGVGES